MSISDITNKFIGISIDQRVEGVVARNTGVCINSYVWMTISIEVCRIVDQLSNNLLTAVANHLQENEHI